MKELKPTSQYKKDYKRFRNNPKKMEKLFAILELLRQEKPIPEENRPHPLTGKNLKRQAMCNFCTLTL